MTLSQLLLATASVSFLAGNAQAQQRVPQEKPAKVKQTLKKPNKTPPNKAITGGAWDKKVICGYDAAPQGFTLEIYKRIMADGNEAGQFARVSQTKPKYYTATPPHTALTHAHCEPASQFGDIRTGACLLGEQDIGDIFGGLANGGKSFLKDSLNIGVPISGNAYIVIDHPVANHYDGPIQEVATNIDTCSQGSFGIIQKQLNFSSSKPPNAPAVPLISAASLA